LFETNSEAFNRAKLDASQPITGKQYLDAAAGFLDANNVLSQEQRKSLDTHRNPNVDGPFAKQSDPAVYSNVLQKQLSGTLTMADLNASQGDLTIQDWKSLAEGMQTESSQSLQSTIDAVDATFNFNKFTAPTDDGQKESQAAAAYVKSQLLIDFNAARASGNPMTSTQLIARKNELVADRMVTYRVTLQAQLTDALEAASRLYGLPPVPVGRELEELEKWYNDASISKTQIEVDGYFQALITINQYKNMMGGQ
jgi:hypothetical protein